MKRYEITLDIMHDTSTAQAIAVSNERGSWVRWEDVEALEAENNQLKDDICRTAKWYTVALDKNKELEHEVAELREFADEVKQAMTRLS